jgi:hypothetical protein
LLRDLILRSIILGVVALLTTAIVGNYFSVFRAFIKQVSPLRLIMLLNSVSLYTFYRLESIRIRVVIITLLALPRDKPRLVC